MTIGLRVLRRSRSVLAVYKPPMISTSTTKDINKLLTPILNEEPALYPVHRLDKGTTGVLLYALNPQVARNLSKQWQSNLIEKEYIAIVRGDPGDRGVVSDKLSVLDRHSELNVKGTDAVTAWESLFYNRFHNLSLVRLLPKTGKKHQLRVHMASSLECPILGDERYSRQTKALERARHQDGFRFGPGIYAPPHRMFLHARKLGFELWERPEEVDEKDTNPNPARTRVKSIKKRIEVEALLPPDFAKLCSALFIGWEEKVGEPANARLKSGVPLSESCNQSPI